MTDSSAGLGWVEKLLALWIFLCIVIGLALGNTSPISARILRSVSR